MYGISDGMVMTACIHRGITESGTPEMTEMSTRTVIEMMNRFDRPAIDHIAMSIFTPPTPPYLRTIQHQLTQLIPCATR